jgi:hypothetical protein
MVAKVALMLMLMLMLKEIPGVAASTYVVAQRLKVALMSGALSISDVMWKTARMRELAQTWEAAALTWTALAEARLAVLLRPGGWASGARAGWLRQERCRRPPR